MRVGQRLFLAVIPAILGVLAVAALAYWGRPSYRAPEVLVVTAIAASIFSLLMAWTNTRYVAQRIERLAGRQRRSSADVDEIDQLESVVDHLSSAIASAEADRSRTRDEVQHRQQEYASLLSQISTSTLQKIEEVRLPIHILLENRFGDLNENQEEMLGAARIALESADVVIRQMLDLLELDLGHVALHLERVALNDIVQSVLPLVQADAERVGVHLIVDLTPGVPSLRVDRARVQRAFSSLLRAQVGAAPTGATLHLGTEVREINALVVFEPSTVVARDAEMILAERLVSAHGGAVIHRGDRLEIVLPTFLPLASGSES